MQTYEVEAPILPILAKVVEILCGHSKESLWNASCCVSVSYIELYFRQTQQYTNELSHTTYILEFIDKIVQL
jgi:hypothetical protein